MKITVQCHVNAPMSKVWDCWTKPTHITQWNFASDEWHCPSVNNNLEVGGAFNWRMESKDGSMGFDFEGIYDQILHEQKIVYTMSDGRSVSIDFNDEVNGVLVKETFEAEDQNQAELQKQGWQAILNNFKNYVEELV